MVCGEKKSTSTHHGWKAGQGGDDVPANLFGVDGTGTTGCHGRLESNDPVALRLLGEHVLRARPDFIDYVVRKLDGDETRARAWLERHMLVESV